MTNSIPQLGDGEQTVYFQAGDEWCFLKTPKTYKASNGAVPCVIQCHGHHGYVKDGEADWLTEDFKLSFVNSLIDTGIAVASTNATGNHWGRPNAVAANAALFDALLEGANLDSNRMGLWGASNPWCSSRLPSLTKALSATTNLSLFCWKPTGSPPIRPTSGPLTS